MAGFRLLVKRGTDDERRGTVLASGEPCWTTDTKQLFIGDGVTAGGILVAGGGGGGGSVAWADITGKPATFPPSAHTHDYTTPAEVLALIAGATIAWTSISGKPATFPPQAHTHAVSDISGLSTTLNGLDAAIAAEIAARIADVDAEETARIAAVAAEAGTRGAADAALEANKVNRTGDDAVSGTLTVGSSKALDQVGTGERMVLAQTDGRQRAEDGVTWNDGTATLDVDGTVRATTLAADDMAGAGERVVVAEPTGVVRDVDQLTWEAPVAGYNDTTGGASWSTRSVPTSNNYSAKAFGSVGARIVAGTYGGDQSWYSDDLGETWNLGQPSTAGGFTTEAMVYALGYLHAFANSGRCGRSVDGASWSHFISPVARAWKGAAFNGSRIVVVSSDIAADCVMTSDDGVNWNMRNAPQNGWQSAAFGAGLFVAVGQSGTQTARAMTSPDGVTWTSRTTPNIAQQWKSVAFGNGIFVAVGSNGGMSQVMTSPDGITWTERTAQAGVWRSVAFGGGCFVAVGDTGAIMASTDGITWVSRTSGTSLNLNGVAHDGFSRFLRGASSAAPATMIAVSGDGFVAAVPGKLKVEGKPVSTRYRHVQGTASTSWNIEHGLGEYPSVTVVDSAGNVCLGDVKYVSPNRIIVSFGAAFAGSAYIN